MPSGAVGAQSSEELGGVAKQRRPRWTPSEEAKAILEAVFAADSFPTFAVRNQLAEQLKIDSRQVQIWFQNRRQRERLKTGSQCAAADDEAERGSAPYPVEVLQPPLPRRSSSGDRPLSALPAGAVPDANSRDTGACPPPLPPAPTPEAGVPAGAPRPDCLCSSRVPRSRQWA